MILLKNLMMNENLSEYEKELVYGNLLENIDDIVLMNETTDPLTGETENKINISKEINKASGHVNAATRNRVATDNQFKNGNTSISNKIEAENNERQAKLNQTRVNNKIANLGEADITYLKNNLAAAQKTVDIAKQQKENTLDRLDKNIEQKQERVDRIKQNIQYVNQNSTTADNKELSTTNEQYSFLFKNDDGKILEHFINNTPLTDYKLSKLASLMESDESVNNIVKKINYYYNKPELCYESYIDMKVQRGKFKEKYYSLKK